MRIHEIMGENRARFAQRLNEMSEDLANIAKEVDKTRKTVRGWTSLIQTPADHIIEQGVVDPIRACSARG